MRLSLIAASLLTAFLATPALAQEAAPLTGNLSFTNNYLFRGITQTDDKPALQGGFDYGHASGFYAGTWASNISWLNSRTDGDGNDVRTKSSLEWDVYGGYKFSAGPVAFDVGALQYFYPGAKVSGAEDADTTELYAAASWKWFTAKYSHAVTNLFGVENSKNSYYPELNFAMDVGSGFTASAHVGRQHVKGGGSYNDWKVGVSKELFGVTVGAYYVDTDISEPRGVVSVGKTF
ncbi:MAG: TorF family putative porin [Candidatus Dactylopiibacterium sp.]|nr:TorF family putative porin [Candidatus Dactylopiibacterium sp.]